MDNSEGEDGGEREGGDRGEDQGKTMGKDEDDSTGKDEGKHDKNKEWITVKVREGERR